MHAGGAIRGLSLAREDSPRLVRAIPLMIIIISGVIKQRAAATAALVTYGPRNAARLMRNLHDITAGPLCGARGLMPATFGIIARQ